MSLTQAVLLTAGALLLAAAGVFTITCSLTSGVRRQVERDDAFTEPHRP